MERAFLLFLEFDGTDFCGWQRQASGRSVQLVVENALTELAGRPSRAVAAGRTDAGVHALAMPVSVTMPANWTAPALLRATNARLPRDVATREVREVIVGTNARRTALSRSYRYQVGTDCAARSPFRNRGEWRLGRDLSLPLLQRAATQVLGEHDFRAFAAVGEPKPHYDCKISAAAWTAAEAGRVQFAVTANRFLHHMVRMLVGTMVDIALGRRDADDMTRLLARRDNSQTAAPAPAAGLTFVAAAYPDDCFLEGRAAW
jgi:tRNA pseudouridine38-40 synthase